MRGARILVPPGIGDGYWVLTKLRGFMQRKGIESASVHVHGSGPRRSDGMWRRVPFVSWGGYAELPRGFEAREILRRAYHLAGYPVQRHAFGFDFFLSLNGSLDHGVPMADALPGPTNWFEPLTGMDSTEAGALAYRARFGEYVAVGVWDHGFYRHWLARFPVPRLLDVLRGIADSGRTVVLMGASFDKGGLAERLAEADPRFVSLVGATDFDALTGLLAGAAAVFGFPAGNTMLGPRFGAPTLLLWCDHFPRAFWFNACPPVKYRALDAKGAEPEQVLHELAQVAA